MSTRNLGRALTAIALCVMAAGCSSFEKRVAEVESRQAALEAQITDLQTAQQNIVARLVQLRQELDNALLPLRTQSADRGEDLRSIGREFTALQEQYAELDSRISRLTEQLASGQGAAGAAPQLGTAMPPPRGARAPAGQPSGSRPASNQAMTLYNSAFNDYLRENWDLCIQGFEEYIRRFSMSDRADDARYWVGQCYVSGGNNDSARRAFEALIRDYPDSELVPDAMLNDALILLQEGRNAAAAESFRRLIRAYDPSTSDPAFLACRELEKLGTDRPSSCPPEDQS